MRLPTPTADEVTEFKDLCKSEFNVTLTENEAVHYASKIVQLFYVKNYWAHRLCPPDERDITLLDRKEING